jgi:hypothetical protein
MHDKRRAFSIHGCDLDWRPYLGGKMHIRLTKRMTKPNRIA